jgi:TPR repeat protein
MNWRRTTTIGIIGLVVVAAGTYFGMQALRREGRAVDDGVVEFKKGNYETAVRMLTPYADRGNKAAELNLGIAYAFGLGLHRNRDRAHALFRESLGARAPDTYLWVAKSFETGDGVGRDAEEAIAWYRIAANDGSKEALQLLQRLRPADR